jgi:hypothetical protein
MATTFMMSNNTQFYALTMNSGFILMAERTESCRVDRASPWL